MAEDIAPALLDKVQKAFKQNLEEAKATRKDLLERIERRTIGSVTQQASKVGKSLSRAYIEVLTPEVMPDGVMYYNIAEKVMVPTIEEAYKLVSDVADAQQLSVNRMLNIGIKPIRPPIEMDRVNGLLNAVSNGLFADNIHYLNEPIRNIVEHFSDNHFKENMRFLDNSGVGVVVVRRAESTACEWCHDRAGTYDSYYEAQANEVFARHEGCRCELEIRGRGTSGKMQARGHAFVRA